MDIEPIQHLESEALATNTTVVSAADHKYARSLWQFLRSAERHGLPSAHTFIVFDLGMTEADRRGLTSRFAWCRFEPFPFDRYPAHVRRLVSCSWKPIIIDALLERRGGLLLWLDAATIAVGSLAPLFERAATLGVMTLVGQSPLTRWCHPLTLAAMQVPEGDFDKLCRFGGAIGFDASNALVRELVAQWRDAALRAECIDPPGADRSNHRYDQSLLTNLLYAFERERGLVLTHDEVDISSGNPVRWITTRNKVAPWVPTAADPLARAWFATYKAVDRAAIRARRGRSKGASGPPTAGRG